MKRWHVLLIPVVLTPVGLTGHSVVSELWSDAAMAAQTADVTPDTLQHQLTGARAGHTLRLAPGVYPRLALNGRSVADGITIESANRSNPARIGQVDISKVRGLTLRGVMVEGALAPADATALISVRQANDVTIEDVGLMGSPDGAAPRMINGIFLQGVQNVRLERNQVRRLRFGFAYLASRGLAIRHNEICDMATDGMRGGGTDDLLIEGNVIGGFTPRPGAHPDGIQVWTANQKAPARNILIRDNLVVRDGGNVVQGIFVRDNTMSFPFEALQITGNLIVGGMYNGIAVQGGRDVTITDNHVVAYNDMKSWIRVQGAQQLTLTGNSAAQLLLTKNGKVDQQRNRRDKVRRPGDLSALTPWLAARPQLVRRPGGYLERLAAAAPGERGNAGNCPAVR
ncbi:right-handed parallel beta-helix repeat-containing protein [Sphingomonas sp. FW199]|uniref:right-handed parallel beta-helix repeat-containing protein n=1 Tax=Sphingomonas sp. FW199 TaxID=3400217 RepID=UPI003CEC0069